MKKRVLLLTTPLLLSSLVGCSTLYNNTVGLLKSDAKDGEISFEDEAAAMQETAEAGALSDTSQRLAKSSGSTANIPVEGAPEAVDEVEVLWKIPEEPVDGFVLKYGFDRAELNKEVSLTLEEIEKYDDPDFGFVYRHVLKDIPPSKKVFVRLATKSKGKLTPFSETFEVAAE